MSYRLTKLPISFVGRGRIWLLLRCIWSLASHGRASFVVYDPAIDHETAVRLRDELDHILRTGL